MDNSPHNDAAQSAPIEPPALPDRWRSAELADSPHDAAAQSAPVEPPALPDRWRSAELADSPHNDAAQSAPVESRALPDRWRSAELADSPHNDAAQSAPVEPPALPDRWRSAELADSPHDAAAQSAPVEPPALPDRWRSAELAVGKDPHLAARRPLRTTVRVALVVLALALVIVVPLWIAAAHYARGVDALEVHSYSKAVNEFSGARVLVFPYRDARSLEEQARRALMAENVRGEQAETGRAAVVGRLEKARARLEAGDAHGVLTTLRAIDEDDLRATLDSSETARESADALAADLAAASRRALRHAAWERAGRYAAALLVLEPSSKPAAALGARARTGEGLSAKLGKAKDAARSGKWREALRLARAVLATQKDFPGAAAVVAHARVALAPKPQPAATTAASPPTQATVGPATPTPPQPPPP